MYGGRAAGMNFCLLDIRLAGVVKNFIKSKTQIHSTV